MKVILVGSTGLIGQEVLRRALVTPAFTEIVIISRRDVPLPAPSAGPKQSRRVILHKDFESYPSGLMSDLAGAEACIWSLGVASLSSAPENRKINHIFAMAGINAFAESLAPRVPAGKRFRFVYLGGALTIRDPNASSWFYGSEARKMRGRTEVDIIALPDRLEQQAGLETTVARPAAVVASSSNNSSHGAVQTALRFHAMPASWTIANEQLAAALVHLAVRGNGGRQTWENADLKRKGAEELALSPSSL